MTKSNVDLTSLFMVLSFTINIFIGFLDPTEIPVSKEVGVVFLICGGLIFVYVLLYLRSGFFGETEPKLDFLVTKGPYRFCRHPLYLSFIIMILGIDLMFKSVIGVAFTLALSIPSVVYRARIEDALLRKKFGEEWENYADRVGFLFPGCRGGGKMISEEISKREIYAIGLLIVLGSEFLLRDVFLPEKAGNIHIGMAIIVEWLTLVMLLVFWIPKVEGNKLGSVGFGKFRWRYLWMGVLVYFILLIVWAGSGFALKAIGLEGLRSLQPMIREYSFPILFGLFLTGTFLEEIFYRGYTIERLTSLLGRRWLAGIISWAAFTFVHLKFFGLGPTLDVGVLSAGLVFLYLRERSIWPCIIVHGINDVIGFIIGPLLM